MTQKVDIIEYLQTHQSITRWEAFTYLGIAELSSRIGELTAEGFEIPRKSIEVTARNGRKVRVMQYLTPTRWA